MPRNRTRVYWRTRLFGLAGSDCRARSRTRSRVHGTQVCVCGQPGACGFLNWQCLCLSVPGDRSVKWYQPRSSLEVEGSRCVCVCLCLSVLMARQTADGGRRRRGWLCFTGCVGSNLSPLSKWRTSRNRILVSVLPAPQSHANKLLSRNAPEPESQAPNPSFLQGFCSRPHAKNAMAWATRGAATVNTAIGPLRRLRSQARLLGSTPHSADARNMLKDAQNGIPKHP